MRAGPRRVQRLPQCPARAVHTQGFQARCWHLLAWRETHRLGQSLGSAVDGGQGNFVSTSTPDGGRIGALTALARAGKVDLQRVLQLHATMNLSMQAPSMTALDSVNYDTPKRPHPGKALALSHSYAVGGPVLHELLKNWPCYRDEIPGTAKKKIPARRQCATFPRSLARMRDTRPFRSAAATNFENCS